MAERSATAEWNGTLKEGTGKMALGSGAFEGAFSFATRMGDEPGTNPEELIGASLAGCFAMALNAALEQDGTPANSVNAEAKVFLGKDENGFKINRIDLFVDASVDGMEKEAFRQVAETVKQTCPVSKALAAVPINLTASLANGQSDG